MKTISFHMCIKLHTQTYLCVCLHVWMQSHASQGTVCISDTHTSYITPVTFTSADIIFHIFFEFHSTLFEKQFLSQFSFFTGLNTHAHQTLREKTLERVSKYEKKIHTSSMLPTLPFYGKNLNPCFLQKFWKLKPLLFKVEEVPTIDWFNLRQFQTIESLLKLMKNVFYFTIKALFILEIFTFLSWLFGYVEKWLDNEAMVNFKIYDVTDWTASNYNIHTTKYLKK